jgi:hypothetical protein
MKECSAQVHQTRADTPFAGPVEYVRRARTTPVTGTDTLADTFDENHLPFVEPLDANSNGWIYARPTDEG